MQLLAYVALHTRQLPGVPASAIAGMCRREDTHLCEAFPLQVAKAGGHPSGHGGARYRVGTLQRLPAGTCCPAENRQVFLLAHLVYGSHSCMCNSVRCVSVESKMVHAGIRFLPTLHSDQKCESLLVLTYYSFKEGLMLAVAPAPGLRANLWHTPLVC